MNRHQLINTNVTVFLWMWSSVLTDRTCKWGLCISVHSVYMCSHCFISSPTWDELTTSSIWNTNFMSLAVVNLAWETWLLLLDRSVSLGADLMGVAGVGISGSPWSLIRLHTPPLPRTRSWVGCVCAARRRRRLEAGCNFLKRIIIKFCFEWIMKFASGLFVLSFLS